MALVKEFLEQHEDGTTFYRVFSNAGKDVLQVETNNVYGEVCITDDDPYTYKEIKHEGDDEEATAEDIAEAIGGLL